MRGYAFALLVAASFRTAATAMAQTSDQTERVRGERVYLEGRPVDAVLLPDGSIAYVLQWPPAEARDESDGPWILLAHPVRGGVQMPIDPLTGERVAIGTDADGTYHGFAWFMESVPSVIQSGDRVTWTPVYETNPPDVEKGYAERAAPSQTLQGAAVQKWWADWEEWLENLQAGDLVPHSGVVSGCRETEEATVVTMKGDGTFQFLYRDRDRVTYEGLQVSSPCDVVGQTVIAWTLPCGDDGPCIRKIQAVEGSTESPRAAPKVESVAEAPVPHAGLIDACRPRQGATVVTVKGDGTFQFLHRSRDRVVYEAVQASSPCDLIGSNVVVWTVACDEDVPCISKVEGAPRE